MHLPWKYEDKMTDLPLNNWIKPEVLKQSLYFVELPPGFIKLNQNESPWDLPDSLKQEILTRIGQRPWNRYPDLFLKNLNEKIAGKLNVSQDSIIISKGSNEILQSVCNIVLRPSDFVCTLSPSFALYHLLSELRGAKILPSPLTESFLPDDLDLQTKSKKSRLTFLCNPNSPTGTLLSIDLIHQVLKETDGLIVVDEAYVDFSGLTSVSLLNDFSNLIITRTFSKAFSVAGFRIGYAVMHPELCHEVRKGLLPFNVDISACVAMEVLLDYSELVQNRALKIVKERDQLINKLNKLDGVRAWPSSANFFLLETPLDAITMYESFLNDGILVRNVSSYPGCERMVRITIGSPEENQMFYSSVKNIL